MCTFTIYLFYNTNTTQPSDMVLYNIIFIVKLEFFFQEQTKLSLNAKQSWPQSCSGKVMENNPGHNHVPVK